MYLICHGKVLLCSTDGSERRFLCLQVGRLPFNVRKWNAVDNSSAEETTAFSQNSRVCDYTSYSFAVHTTRRLTVAWSVWLFHAKGSVQSMQNAAMRFLLDPDVEPRWLHWLPVSRRVKCKNSCLVRREQFGQAAMNLSSLMLIAACSCALLDFRRQKSHCGCLFARLWKRRNLRAQRLRWRRFA